VERIYMNRIEGQRRIHIEIDDAEISDLLDDLNDDVEHFAATRQLLQILHGAEEIFAPTVNEGRSVRYAPAAGQSTTEPLTVPERQILTFALELAADQMSSRSNEFDDEDEAALARLRRLAGEDAQ